ncbi:hypothetical protein Ga0074812_13811 [Parafrankia irregularis]|uniref:Uncharacterized protein n=1 Tax=Parafrankia irregularis TaxID=795642 RepID=A0A0S4QZU6_9ACTN|nr:hypothetical protein Ga0074812_13811 [Parafrankia irregularis]
MRNAWLALTSTRHGGPTGRDGAAEAVEREALADRMREIDANNTAWLRAVIAEHGWLGESLVGPVGASDAWLIAQHADHDPEFQAECLELLRAAATAGDASTTHLAYLTDRVLCARDEPQIYGTQFWRGPQGTDALGPRPIADPEHLDARRAAAGLDPFATYLAHMTD